MFNYANLFAGSLPYPWGTGMPVPYVFYRIKFFDKIIIFYALFMRGFSPFRLTQIQKQYR
jgi:hypothetical protein